MMTRAKVRARLGLLDDLLDYALRSSCVFALCDGPKAPIRHGRTCGRCACIHRALKMGLVKEVKEQYVRKTPRGNVVISAGFLEQFSVLDGKRI